ncbi:MAG: HigA family addiction module antitoxin [Hespellia sp.]|nr:HigA family addiction module antitoxin [Hespellia sp.]
MSNYIEFNDKIAFHPGYYIKELVDESGLTQEDFAKRLGTTPKNLSILIRGEQSLSIDIAVKLSRMIGTSMNYWLNLQNAYDSLVAEFKSREELLEERRVFKLLDYKYFRENLGAPDLSRKTDQQIEQVRTLLKVASLTVLEKQDLAVSFRSSANELTSANVIKANVMVQIAINETLKIEAPKYNKAKFEEAVKYALTLTTNHGGFYPLMREAFMKSGVVLVVLPNLSGSKINGATKKVGNNVMLMVNDRRMFSDTFWFTLFHEVGHIMNGDFGITFEKETEGEDAADKYAEDALIPPEKYQLFVNKGEFTIQSIRIFAEEIGRDPGIVLGRLKNDKKVEYTDWALSQAFAHKYKIVTKW